MARRRELQQPDQAAALLEDHVPGPEETLDQLLPEADGDQEPSELEGVEILDPASRGERAEPMAAELGIELPTDPEEAKAVLLRELFEARQEAGEYLETLQRVAAEFDNHRKRVERDQADNVRRASQRIIEQLLPSLDNFDAALAYEAQTPAEEKILDGLGGTHAQLMDTLSKEGLRPVPGPGQPFDPAVHEAVAGPQSEGEGELVVATVLRRGYTLQGRVIRPALVTVELGPAASEQSMPAEPISDEDHD